MIEIVKIEGKRILNMRILSVFLAIVVMLSAYSSYSILRCYHNIPVPEGDKITWQENLAHAKTNLRGKSIDREFLNYMRKYEGEFVYIDEWNLDELAAANYEGKSVRDLSDADIDSFYDRRLSNIRTMLEESQRIRYTQEEIEQFIKSAEQVSEIPFGYAEGWKVLNSDMGIFTAILLILIVVMLLPLFGTDPKSNMKELYRGTRYGKKPLDNARMITAFLTGAFLYISGIFLFFIIKMFPFGLEGWNQCIQSNRDTFFSLYYITNLQQFLLNVLLGFAALLLTISLLLFITVIMERVMTGAVVFAFFWILLLLFDQMHLWQLNHYFANFMPLRMTSFSHYYVDNEVYRIFGYSLSCMTWCVLLTIIVDGTTLILTIVFIKVKRKKGIY